jgi:hypothetical protein
MFDRIENHITEDEKKQLASLDTPVKIQAFMDSIVYEPDYRNRSCLNVMRDRRGHCLDGGLFAAAMLRRLGYPPRVVDIFPQPGTDDDHILALFKMDGCWGAVAKSNYVGLRYREPVYRNLRELIMSYFDVFFNVDGLRTLRTYTRPVRLTQFDPLSWETEDTGVDFIEQYLRQVAVIDLLTPAQAARLTILDPASMKAGTIISNPEGFYKPK